MSTSSAATTYTYAGENGEVTQTLDYYPYDAWFFAILGKMMRFSLPPGYRRRADRRPRPPF
jgi:hypothetical protein